MVCDNPIDAAVNQITETLIAAAENSIPKTKNNFRRQRKVWWNSDCREAYKNQRKAWGRFRRCPTSANLILYKQAKAYSRRIQRRSQRESWERYVSSQHYYIQQKTLGKIEKSIRYFYRSQYQYFIPKRHTCNFSSGYSKLHCVHTLSNIK
ncbi:hypothetical protein AVEN_216907-1 [Araneus ventricosus]|uniref:Uncharacterized protein n=1 Tax=Araneus ventricosus TaxID=182803 RepID=A0A4Y2L899_ARAVE|nr:hypothetical protein AVEN_216907-1 [Araneus ventricosus]